MKNIFSLICVMFSLLFFANLARAESCENLWSKHVKKNPKGQVKEYQMDIKVDMPVVPPGGWPGANGPMFFKHEILESTPNLIKERKSIKGSSSKFPPKIITLTKDSFVTACQKFNKDKLPTLPEEIKTQMKIVETKPATITVKAGKFKCLYTKMTTDLQTSGQSVQTVVEMWTEGNDFSLDIILMNQKTVISFNGKPGNQESKMELVSIKKPL